MIGVIHLSWQSLAHNAALQKVAQKLGQKEQHNGAYIKRPEIRKNPAYWPQ
jgi:hypothetical protein